MKANLSDKKTAVIITFFLALCLLSSFIYLLTPRQQAAGYIADIYQNGVLIKSIPLYGTASSSNPLTDSVADSDADSAADQATGSYTFTVEGENGCVNEIRVRSGSIAIISADCPDKLCVNQGYISDTKLPITCLPNRLVIQLRPADTLGDSAASEAVDIITY